MFQIGQQVVCVFDDWVPCYEDSAYPVAKMIYTIREIINHGDAHPTLYPCLRFFEIKNKPMKYDENKPEFELSFCLYTRQGDLNFRPLQKKTNIDVFQNMLPKLAKTFDLNFGGANDTIRFLDLDKPAPRWYIRW